MSNSLTTVVGSAREAALEAQGRELAELRALVEGVGVEAGVQVVEQESGLDEAVVVERVAAFTAWGYAPTDALAEAGDYAEAGEHGVAAVYREVARRLQAAVDADLVTVGSWGSDGPLHVAREGVALEVDEAQWRADNAVGLAM